MIHRDILVEYRNYVDSVLNPARPDHDCCPQRRRPYPAIKCTVTVTTHGFGFRGPLNLGVKLQ